MSTTSTLQLSETFSDPMSDPYSKRNGALQKGAEWGRNNRSLLLPAAAAAILGLVLGLLIGRFAISRDTSNGGGSYAYEELVREASEETSQLILDGIDPKRIEENLRLLSEKPHIAGKQADFDQADLIKRWFHDNGLGVQSATYDVLLSYPNGQIPNSVRLVNNNGDVIYDAVADESDISKLEGVVPPFHAYAPARLVHAPLMFVNYGRVEDYDWLRAQNKSVAGCIVIAKLGAIFRGSIVDIAADNGAVGVLAYPDPTDYTGKTRGDDRVFPETWWMPPDGAQRGTILIGSSDPLTPGWPANDLAYRYPESEVDPPLPLIPSQPIGYAAAAEILKRMSGPVAPLAWQGGLNLVYRLGPGFTDSDLKVELNVTNQNKLSKAENVFGIIEGAVEPDRYVLLGNHRDAWIYGAVDPSSATAVLLEIARVMGELVKAGKWRPRRTIILCSWAAEEYGLIGSTEWVEQYLSILRERVVAYLNIDIAVQGNDTFTASSSPLMESIVHQAAGKVKNPNPSEVAAGRPTVLDTWKHVTRSGARMPLIGNLGSGSDYASLVQRVGASSVDSRYTYDTTRYPIPSYALYHTEYETFDVVKKQFDTGFEFHTAVARVNAEMVRHIADALLLPFDLANYGRQLRKAKVTLDTSLYGAKLRSHLNNYEKLVQVISEFEGELTAFQHTLENLDKNNPYVIRQANDQIHLLEKSFLVPEGLPLRSEKKHILWAENSNDAYAGSSFPGLLDLLFHIDLDPDSQGRWEKVKEHFSAIMHTIRAAGASLRPVTGFIGES